MPNAPHTAERGNTLVTETTRLTHVFGSFARTSAHDLASVVVPRDERCAYTVDDRSVCTWSLATGALLRRVALPTPPSRAKPTRAAAISSNGATLFYGRSDGHVVAWDIAGERVASELLAARAIAGAPPSGVASLAVSPVGSRLAVSPEGEAVVRLFAGETLEGQLAGRDPLAFSPDGAALVLGSAAGAAALVDANERRGIAPLTERDDATCAAFSPDGRLIATGHVGFVQVFDRASGRIAWRDAVPERSPGVPGRVDGVFFSLDGRALCVVAVGFEMRDAWTGTLARRSPTSVPQPACAPRSLLLLGVLGKKLVMVDIATGAERKGAGHSDSVTSVAFSSDGTRVASGGRDHRARVWDLASGSERVQLDSGTHVARVAFSLDDARLLVAAGSRLVLADAVTGELVSARTPDGDDAMVRDLAPIADGDVALANDRALSRFDPSTGDLRWRVELSASTVDVGHDGRLRVVGRQGVSWVDAATGAATLAIESIDKTRAQPHFPCAGGLLSVVTGRGLVLRDPQRGDVLRTFAGSEKALAILAVSPDARTAIVSMSDDADEVEPTTLPLVEIWDTIESLRRDAIDLAVGADRPMSAAFSPDGSQLALGTARGLVQVFALTERPPAPVRDVVLGLLRDAAAENLQGGRWADELLMLRQAVAHAENGLDKDDPDRLLALAGLAEVLTRLGRLDEAGSLHETTLASAERVHGLGSVEYARMASNAGRFWLLQSDAAHALTLFEAALGALRHALGPRDREVAMALSNVGVAYLALGDLDRAEPLLAQAVDLFRATTGERDAECARAIHNLGTVRAQSGDVAGAEPLLERSLAIRRELLGDDHLDVGEGLTALATLYLMSGDPRRAEPLYRASLELHERMLGQYHLTVAARAVDLSSALRATGGTTEALGLLERALVIRTERLGERHADTQRTASTLAALAKALDA